MTDTLAAPRPRAEPNCLECKHYYITWDSSFPCGCRALGFKSRQLPCQEVLRASGEPCLAFEARERRA
ncbi:MAG: hypothetical protein ACYC2R_00010 [Burkholderiales bacterium]